MAPHSSTLAWKIPWTEEPGRLQSTGSRRLSNFTFTFHFHALEKEMATHSSILAWRIPGMGEPSGLPSMGLHRVGHNWSDLAVAAAVKKIKTKWRINPSNCEHSVGLDPLGKAERWLEQQMNPKLFQYICFLYRYWRSNSLTTLNELQGWTNEGMY